MRQTRNITVTIIAAYFTLLAIFFLLAVVTGLIPRHAVEQHLVQSVHTIGQEGEYPVHGISLLTQDNFTDCVMLNIAAGADNGHPVASAMDNTLHMSGRDIIASTSRLLDGNPVEARSYARYWHGYQVLLRPLLCLTDYRGIRVINGAALALLALLCIVIGYWRVSRPFALSLAAGLLLTGCWIVPLNMQFTSCFAVMLAALLAVMLGQRALHSTGAASVAFFVIGGVTQYLDLLTTPLITLGLPLIAWMLIHKPGRASRTVVLLSLMWGLGYASLWASKWLIAGLVTGNDVLGDAINSVRIRSVGGEMAEQGLTAADILRGYWNHFAALGLAGWGALAALTIAVVALYRCCGRPYRVIGGNLWLLLVAAMPLVWALVLTQHTFLHHFFTWRIVLVTLVAIMLFICHTITLSRRI